MERLKYFFGEALKNLWKNRMMSFAAVGVLAICLLLLGSTLLISLNIEKIIVQVESKNQIMVFLDDKLDSYGIEEVGAEIRALPNVQGCVFVSKEEAFEQQKKELGSDADLLNGYNGGSFMPNGYQVQLKSMAGYAQTVKSLKSISGIIKLREHSDVAAGLTNIKNVVNMVGLWLFIILAAVALFIISNTIKLALYVRKREINIMKFVGATDWFIRWPFVFEGILIGLLAALLAFAAECGVYFFTISKVMGELRLSEIAFGHFETALLLLAFVGTGVFVGACGSAISVRKYLKV